MLTTSQWAIVKTVDGREVPGGDLEGTFELLPGCHIVGIGRRYVASRFGFRYEDFGRNTFILDMKPGHEYAIFADNGLMATALYATEWGPSGTRIRTINPVHPASAPQACAGSGGVRDQG